MRPEETIRGDEAGEGGQSAGAVLDRTLTTALERRPQVAVPVDFAARVMGRLPEDRPGQAYRDRRGFSVGRAMGYVSAAVTTAALAALAIAQPAALQAGKSMAFCVEVLLIAELLGVGLWLGTRREA